MKKEKLFDILNILIFCVAISIPLLGYVLGISLPKDNSEWRVLSKFPPSNMQFSVPNFIKAFDNYFNDHFVFRTWMIQTFSTIKLNTFHSSPVFTDMIGKNGWIFHNPIPSYKFKEFYDHVMFTPKELVDIKNKLVSEKNWLESKNIAYMFVIVPDKEIVYTEHYAYPDYLISNIRLNQLLDYLHKNSDLDIVYLKDALVKMKDKRSLPLYYKSDTHWNNYGAFFGYQEIMKNFQKYNSDIQILNENDFDITLGDGNDIAVDDLMRLNPVKMKHEVQINLNLKNNVARTIRKLQKVYIYGDSFSINPRGSTTEGLNSFLNLSFKNLSSNYYLYSLEFEKIEKDKPELVIRELVQRFLVELTKLP